MSVKFADIVQSCQVQMIKNLEVVSAFSAKKFFGHTKIFRDIIQIFPISQNNTISHKIDRICPVNLKKKQTISRFSLTFCGILFFVCRQIPSFADNLFSGGVSHPPHPPIRDGPVCKKCLRN